jgi:hypothetical protein
MTIWTHSVYFKQSLDYLVCCFLGLFSPGLLPVVAQAAPAPMTDSSIDTPQAMGELDERPLAQVTSVSQLSDIRPTDWAFQALQSLIERYGCISGYPNQQFRGDRAITRYEFAAGINACLERVTELISSAKSELASQQDLATMQQLQTEFASELATLRGRVDTLEERTQTLTQQQFSTTTKLDGVVVWGLQGRTRNQADFFPVDGVKDTIDPGTNVTLGYSAQINLITQFSPKSLLLIGLQAGNARTSPFLSNNVRLAYEGDTNSTVQISDLTYRQLVGRNFALIAGAEGVSPVNVFRGANRVESSAYGPISAFAQRNPIIAIGGGRSGLGFDWQIGSRVSLQGLYAASDAANPGQKAGLFNGNNVAGLQIAVAPTTNTDVALHYIHAYNTDGSLQTGVGDTQLTPNGEPINTNAYGATASWRISSKATIGGWGGWSNSKIPSLSGSVNTFNWMAFLNFPDLGGRGNLAGLYIGQPPRITSSDLPTGLNLPNLLSGGLGGSGGQERAATHIEAFYRWKISDNLSITPGMVAIFNQGNASSDPVLVGAIRTSLRF